MIKRQILISITLFLLISTVQTQSSQSCLGIDGKQVTWWVQLIFPGTFSNGFGYMDNRSTSSSF
jgi:hypothetical protein